MCWNIILYMLEDLLDAYEASWCYITNKNLLTWLVKIVLRSMLTLPPHQSYVKMVTRWRRIDIWLLAIDLSLDVGLLGHNTSMYNAYFCLSVSVCRVLKENTSTKTSCRKCCLVRGNSLLYKMRMWNHSSQWLRPAGRVCVSVSLYQKLSVLHLIHEHN